MLILPPPFEFCDGNRIVELLVSEEIMTLAFSF